MRHRAGPHLHLGRLARAPESPVPRAATRQGPAGSWAWNRPAASTGTQLHGAAGPAPRAAARHQAACHRASAGGGWPPAPRTVPSSVPVSSSVKSARVVWPSSTTASDQGPATAPGRLARRLTRPGSTAGSR